MLYFAYGSDLNWHAMLDWGKANGQFIPPRPTPRPAVLANHRLCFPRYDSFWRGGVADVVPEAGKSVSGALYNINPKTAAMLDRMAGRRIDRHGRETGNRERSTAMVSLYRGGEIVEAGIFRLRQPDHAHVPPTQSYLDRLVETAWSLGLSTIVDHAPAQFRHADDADFCLNRFDRCDPTVLQQEQGVLIIMEYRTLGKSGFRIPVLSFGTGTFGGGGDFFKAWGSSDAAEATRLVDVCLEAGLNMFDSADIYSGGAAEEILGAAIKGRRDQVLISTKGTFRSGQGINDVGSSRHHLIDAVNGSLKRLGTEYIDLYQLHGYDATTPMEETMGTLDDLVKVGKIRYLGSSNFSGWHLMKSLAVSEKYGWARHVAHQAYYSLIGRDYEWELMPLGAEQGVSAVVWSPLGWGRLTGKIRRGAPKPDQSRLQSQKVVDMGPQVADDYVYQVVDALDAVAKETGKTVPQIALNWLLQRPTVANVIVGARNEEQLKQNLGAVGWNLTKEQVEKLDAASVRPPPYPYWHQASFRERNPFPTNITPAR